MGRLIISTQMSLDGVIEVGDWYVGVGEHDRAAQGQLDEASALLLGRKTFEGFVAYWSELDDAWANLMNPKRKYVASRTLHGPLSWNASLLEGDSADAVSQLKAELSSDLLVFGCGEFARSLLGTRLVDELRFWIHPAVWGTGERPFQGELRDRLRLLGCESFDSGVVLLRYAPIA